MDDEESPGDERLYCPPQLNGGANGLVIRQFESVQTAWSDSDLTWAGGRGAAQDFTTPDFGLNITFLGQETSRFRLDGSGTLARPVAPADIMLKVGQPLVWVENDAEFEGLNIALSADALAKSGPSAA